MGSTFKVSMVINYEIDGFKMAQWTKLYIFSMVLKDNEKQLAHSFPVYHGLFIFELICKSWVAMEFWTIKKCPKSISNLEQAL